MYVVKKCNKCEIDKELTEFNKKRDSKDCHMSICRGCEKKRREERRLVKEYSHTSKVCIVCDSGKELTEFHKGNTIDGHDNTCKECKKVNYLSKKEIIDEQHRKYYHGNKKEISENKRRYYEKNKERILKCNVKWFENNKEKSKIYYRNRKNNNPHIIAWRDILYGALKRMSMEKTDSTIKMLGYSANDLKSHLESLFTDGMSWYNHGEWHIDHKIPVISFGVNTPPSAVNSLENLQPLWSKDNLSKGNKILEEYKTMDIYIKYCN